MLKLPLALGQEYLSFYFFKKREEQKEKMTVVHDRLWSPGWGGDSECLVDKEALGKVRGARAGPDSKLCPLTNVGGVILDGTGLADTVYVMSNRPGRIVMRREIELPRPRDLEVTYTPEFQAIVHELRMGIGGGRH